MLNIYSYFSIYVLLYNTDCAQIKALPFPPLATLTFPQRKWFSEICKELSAEAYRHNGSEWFHRSITIWVQPQLKIARNGYMFPSFRPPLSSTTSGHFPFLLGIPDECNRVWGPAAIVATVKMHYRRLRSGFLQKEKDESYSKEVSFCAISCPSELYVTTNTILLKFWRY